MMRIQLWSVIQVDEAADVVDDGEIIRVGPKKSTVKREWKQCSVVDYDPSTQGDRRFKGVSQITWNGTELQTPVQNRTPITYFKKAFPIDYLDRNRNFYE